MRVSPIGDYFDTLDDVLKNSKESAKITHHHVEGIKGAQATASAIFLAKQKKDKQKIKEYISETFGYKLDESIDGIINKITKGLIMPPVKYNNIDNCIRS